MAKATFSEISWSAEEYVVRDKTAWWYVGLVVVALILGGISIWLDAWSFLAVVVLGVVALIVYAARPPRVLSYVLNGEGVREGAKMYPYEEFKSFGILQENGHFAIVLNPRKRFAPRVTIYFPEVQGEAIVDALGARLPMEEVQFDMIDKLIKFLRI